MKYKRAGSTDQAILKGWSNALHFSLKPKLSLCFQGIMKKTERWMTIQFQTSQTEKKRVNFPLKPNNDIHSFIYQTSYNNCFVPGTRLYGGNMDCRGWGCDEKEEEKGEKKGWRRRNSLAFRWVYYLVGETDSWLQNCRLSSGANWI